MRALLEHPDQLELLRAEPERIPNAVEEILRWTTVVNYFCRTATTDTEVGGCPVHEGEKLMIWYASGSRDPEANEDPQTFDVTRDEVSHMAFDLAAAAATSASAPASLGFELRVALEQLLSRLQTIELDGEPERLRSPGPTPTHRFRSSSPQPHPTQSRSHHPDEHGNRHQHLPRLRTQRRAAGLRQRDPRLRQARGRHRRAARAAHRPLHGVPQPRARRPSSASSAGSAPRCRRSTAGSAAAWSTPACSSRRPSAACCRSPATR